MIGWTISHYRIVSQLGGGGMGVVNEAEELTLQRHVAPNFLPLEMKNDLVPVKPSYKKHLLHRRSESPAKIVLDLGENDDQLALMGMSVQPKGSAQ